MGEKRSPFTVADWSVHPDLNRISRAGDEVHEASIAVLSLRDLTDDTGTGFFAAAMTDSLVTALGAAGPSKVISRHSVMAYADSDKPIAEIADELDVRFVVEGSVTRSADRVRISCRVIEAAIDRQVLAESYEGDLANTFDVQREAATTIARAILAGVAPAPEPQRHGSVDPEAFARLMVWAGDHDDAAALLERAERVGEVMQIDFLRLSPAWHPLRRHPGFLALQQRMDLPA